MQRQLFHDTDPAASLHPAARTTTATGSSVDLLGFHSALILIPAGAWTDGTHTFEVQESDDDSTFAAVADADLVGDEPVIDGAADDDTVYSLAYLGSKRYVLVKVTVTGSPSTGLVAGAFVLKGHPQYAPATE
jgi:hypothetical protein